MNFGIGAGQLQTQKLPKTQIQPINIIQMSVRKLSKYIESVVIENHVNGYSEIYRGVHYGG